MARPPPRTCRNHAAACPISDMQISALLLFALAHPLPAGNHEISVGERYFLLHVPPQVSAGQPLPLVLNFHGGGGNPQQHQAHTRMDELADREGFVVVYPAGYARKGAPRRMLLTWNAGDCCGPAQDEDSDDVGFVREVLGQVAARLSIDATRVYATGFSNGAMMAYRVARELSGQIAAVAPVSGASAIPPPAGALPMPVLHLHSVDDGRALYRGGEGPPFPFTNRRVKHPAVEDVLRLWARHDGCGERPVAQPPLSTPDGHTATRLTFPHCASGKPVEHLRLTGAGHVWPGAGRVERAGLLGTPTQVIDANFEVWNFLRAWRRPEAPPPLATTAAAERAPEDAGGGGLELPLERTTVSLRLAGTADRPSDQPAVRAGRLALAGRTTLVGRARLDRGGLHAWGLGFGAEGRTFTSDLPAVNGTRFFHLGLSLDGFFMPSTSNLFWVQLGGFVAEQAALLDHPRLHLYGVGLGRHTLGETTALLYGLGYTYDFGRGLPLPFLGLDWRASPTWRLTVLLPLLARVSWQASPALALNLGAAVAGDNYRYQVTGTEELRRLRIGRLRLGAGLRYLVGKKVHLGLQAGVEGASLDDGVTTNRAGGGYLEASVSYGTSPGPHLPGSASAD